MPFRDPPDLQSTSWPFVYSFNTKYCSLEMYTATAELDTIEPGPNHLFMAMSRGLSRCHLLVLRETSSEGCFRLVKCVPCLALILKWEGQAACSQGDMERLQWDLFADPWRNVYVVLQGFHSYWRAVRDGNSETPLFTNIFLGTLPSLTNILSFFQVILDHQWKFSALERQKYTEALKASWPHAVSLDETEVYVTVELRHDERSSRYITSLKNSPEILKSLYYNWSWESKGPWQGYGSLHSLDRTDYDLIYIRRFAHAGPKALRRSILFKLFSLLTRYCTVTGETEEEMAIRGPRAEDASNYCHLWSQAAVDELHLDGSFQQVHIV